MDNLTKLTAEEKKYKALKFLLKSAVGAVPGVGGLSNELFDLLISNPAQKKRDEFMISLAKQLDSLSQKIDIDLENLVNNDGVSAFLLQAIQIAMRSQGTKKLEALRECSARGTVAPDEETRSPYHIVMNILDRLTEHHIILLHWEAKPYSSITLGEMRKGTKDALASLHYGMPTFKDPEKLSEPHIISIYGETNRYIEKQSYKNFQLAKADLIAMGLFEPVLKKEYFKISQHEVSSRITPEIAGYQLSELGKTVVALTDPDADIPNSKPK
jgi:hypothetical protein